MGRRALSFAAVFFTSASLAFAQASGTGSVIGRITDASGAVLPGVTVTLKLPLD